MAVTPSSTGTHAVFRFVATVFVLRAVMAPALPLPQKEMLEGSVFGFHHVAQFHIIRGNARNHERHARAPVFSAPAATF